MLGYRLVRKDTLEMTNKQALTRARTMWGKKAGIRKDTRKGKEARVVGYDLGIGFMVKGAGANWVEAFVDAGEST
jgi:hypothetical protein